MVKAKAKTEKKEANFLLKMDNSKILRGIIETLAAIIDETTILVTPKEFIISAMDPSRICLLKLSIKKDNFDDYRCDIKSKIGLNLDDLDKILKRSTANDSLELDFKEAEQKIKIKMQRADASHTRRFSLTLLDVDIEEVPIGNLLKIEYPSTWAMNPEFLIEAIKDAEIFSEILNMKTVEEEGLLFSSSGQIGEMEYELSLDDLIDPDISETNSGAYSLTFLKAVLKIAPITEKLEISLRTDHPLKMIFTLLEGGELSYFLAPRVNEEDYDEDEDTDEF